MRSARPTRPPRRTRRRACCSPSGPTAGSWCTSRSPTSARPSAASAPNAPPDAQQRPRDRRGGDPRPAAHRDRRRPDVVLGGRPAGRHRASAVRPVRRPGGTPRRAPAPCGTPDRRRTARPAHQGGHRPRDSPAPRADRRVRRAGARPARRGDQHRVRRGGGRPCGGGLPCGGGPRVRRVRGSAVRGPAVCSLARPRPGRAEPPVRPRPDHPGRPRPRAHPTLARHRPDAGAARAAVHDGRRVAVADRG